MKASDYIKGKWERERGRERQTDMERGKKRNKAREDGG